MIKTKSQLVAFGIIRMLALIAVSVAIGINTAWYFGLAVFVLTHIFMPVLEIDKQEARKA